MACIMGLRFAWEHVILAVTSGMTNLNASSSNISWRNEIETSVRSQKRWKISSGKLRRSGLCDLIRVDLFARRDKIYRTSVFGSDKSSAGKLFLIFSLEDR